MRLVHLLRRAIRWTVAAGTVLYAATGLAVASDDPPAGLWFANLEHDFGEVAQGESVTVDFPFENRGKVLLTLSAPIVGCDCTAEVVGSVDVPVGGRGVVRFSCDTSSIYGEQTRTATIHVSDVQRRSVMLTMHGRIALEAVAEPRSVYLGGVLRGSRHPAPVIVRFGAARDRILSLATEGLHFTAAAGKTHRTVVVEIRVDAPLGPFTQNLTIATSNRRFPELIVPISGVVIEAEPPTLW